MIRKFAIAAGLLAAVGAGWVAQRRYDHPSLEAWNEFVLPAATGPTAGAVTVRYYGVATLIFSDGDNAVIIDGFLTRPGGLLRIALGGDVEPDIEKIDRILREDRIARADAVICVHSHYDHAMDAPVVAARTHALLLGSRSTANVGRGWGLPDESIAIAEAGVPRRFGRFSVTLVRSRHVPLPLIARHTLGASIASPLVPPAPASAYLEGATYSVLVEHPLGSALVQGSAGWIDGALDDYDVDVVFLGIAGLAAQGDEYRRTYLDQVVGASDARLVIPIHYDDFTLELGPEVVALPRLADDIPATLDAVYADTKARGVEFAMLPLRKDVVIFKSE